MNPLRTSAMVAAFCASAAIGPIAWAQDALETDERAATTQFIKERPLHAEPIISIEFAGGTLQEYITAIKEAAQPHPLNIIVPDGGGAFPVGPMSLTDVSVASALSVISKGRESVLDGRRVKFGWDLARDPGEGRPVHTVHLFDVGPGVEAEAGSRQSSRDFLVLQIKELTTALPGDPPESVVPAETVLTAIEAVLEIAGNADETKVKYHAPSGLVMIAGPVNSLRAAEQVLSQMSRDTSVRRSRARELQTSQGLTNPEMLESELADAQADLELAQVRMHVASERHQLAEQGLAKTHDLVEGGFVSEGDLEQRRVRMIESQAEIEECRIEMERQHQRVEQLRRSLDRARAISSGGGSANEIDALRTENTMLRDRLAVMEAQLAQLQGRLNSQPGVGRAGTGAGGGRSGGGGR